MGSLYNLLCQELNSPPDKFGVASPTQETQRGIKGVTSERGRYREAVLMTSPGDRVM